MTHGKCTHPHMGTLWFSCRHTQPSLWLSQADTMGRLACTQADMHTWGTQAGSRTWDTLPLSPRASLPVHVGVHAGHLEGAERLLRHLLQQEPRGHVTLSLAADVREPDRALPYRRMGKVEPGCLWQRGCTAVNKQCPNPTGGPAGPADPPRSVSGCCEGSSVRG